MPSGFSLILKMRRNKKIVDEEGDRGFEALLNPIQDIIANNWKVRLIRYIEQYVVHMERIGVINFSEAAIIIQNYTQCLGKRVDIMYFSIVDIAYSLSAGEMSQSKNKENDNKSNPRPKAKCKKKEDEPPPDEIEEVECVAVISHQHLDIPDKNLGSDIIPGTLISSHLKAPCKPGTSCPVYLCSEDELGYKEEFRMHDIVLCEGQLFEEYIPIDTVLEEEAGGSMNGDVEMNGYEDIRDDASDCMDVDLLPVPIDDMASRRSPSPLIHEEPPHDHSGDPPQEHPDDHNNNSNVVDNVNGVDKDPFNKNNVIPFSSLIIHKKFKLRKIFSLPEEFLNEVGVNTQCVQMERRRSERPAGIFNLSFSELLGGRSESMVSYRLRKRHGGRTRRLYKSKKMAHSNMNDLPDINDQDDEDYDDRDDFDEPLNDFRDGDDSAANLIALLDPVRERNIEEAHKQSVRFAQLTKKRDNVLAVQKRVAAWHDMIAPTLAQAERRSIFDVHAYGTEIIEKLEDVGSKKSFFEIASGTEKKDVCR